MSDITVLSGGNLQTALNSAVAGDRILLEAGATFTGIFTLPTKAGVVTLTSTAHASLPNRRIAPGDIALLPTIVSSAASAPVVIGSANNWILDGLRFVRNPSGAGEIISIQGGNNITLRRLIIDILDATEQKRFILGNGTNITVTQCYCAGIWKVGQDSQAFVAWEGAGPYTITDNYLEAASENILFGGADSSSLANMPADILVENNTLSKPAIWEGLPRVVKNIFELKAARRVVVRGNIFERCWVDGQGGTAIVFTPRNQSGTAPWTVVEDVLFEHNIIRDALHGLSILGYDNINQSAQTTNITIRHNLWVMTGGRFAQIGNECGVVRLEHNTYLNEVSVAAAAMIELYAEGTIKTSGGGSRVPAYAVANLVVADSILQVNLYGLRSATAIAGTATLNAMVLGSAWTWSANVLGGAFTLANYPAGTTKIAEADLLGVHIDSSTFLLRAASPYNDAGTDGLDIGWSGTTVPTPPAPAASGGQRRRRFNPLLLS